MVCCLCAAAVLPTHLFMLPLVVVSVGRRQSRRKAAALLCRYLPTSAHDVLWLLKALIFGAVTHTFVMFRFCHNKGYVLQVFACYSSCIVVEAVKCF